MRKDSMKGIVGDLFRRFEAIREHHIHKMSLSRLNSSGGYLGVLDEFEIWLIKNKLLDFDRVAEFIAGETKENGY